MCGPQTHFFIGLALLKVQISSNKRSRKFLLFTNLVKPLISKAQPSSIQGDNMASFQIIQKFSDRMI